MTGKFFLWCAGSDTRILKHCPPSERIKHIGFGTLVLIPAVLAFISMSYALSTLGQLASSKLVALAGGFLWALIIFSFDRYIVSTHRRKLRNSEEFKSPSFYLRFFFAIVLGIVISHPIVLLYFEGSITQKIKENRTLHQQGIEDEYRRRIEAVDNKILAIDSSYSNLQQDRNRQADLVAREIDGEVLRNSKGDIITTGIYGKGPSAENKIKHLNRLEEELRTRKSEDSIQKIHLNEEKTLLIKRSDSLVKSYEVSFDYLQREMALEQLKEANPIVGVTQVFLMLLFILVDILPVTFKTFSPFGLYDRILLDDSKIVRQDVPSDREDLIRQAYQRVNDDMRESVD